MLAGGLGEVTLSEGELPEIQVVDAGDTRSFDADPHAFAWAWRRGGSRSRSGTTWPPSRCRTSRRCRTSSRRSTALPRRATLRFLLADDPGAGKTIMAGLYMKELPPARGRPGPGRDAGEPASSMGAELAERFQLHFVQIDSAMFDATHTRTRGTPTTRDRRQPRLPRTERGRARRSRAAEKEWDLAVVDEAHGFTLAGRRQGPHQQASERYKAAEAVAAKAHRLILMTATPHSGRDAVLWGLLRLLDPDACGDRCPKKLELQPNAVPQGRQGADGRHGGQQAVQARATRTRRATSSRARSCDLYEAVTDFVSKKLAEIRGAGSTVDRRLRADDDAAPPRLSGPGDPAHPRAAGRAAREGARGSRGVPAQPREPSRPTSSPTTRRRSTTSTRTSCGSSRRRRSRSGCPTRSLSWRPSSRRCARCSPWPGDRGASAPSAS